MMLDWVASLMVATVVAVAMVALGVAVVDQEGATLAVGSELSDVVSTITEQVNQDSGLGVATSQNFSFSQGNPGTVLPSQVAGATYRLILTPDFVQASASLPRGSVARSGAFESQVHLWPTTVVRQLALNGEQATLGEIGAWDHAYPCTSFYDDVTFEVQVLEVWVDGTLTYLTLLSVVVGQTAAC